VGCIVARGSFGCSNSTNLVIAHAASGLPIGAWVTATRTKARRILEVAERIRFGAFSVVICTEGFFLGCWGWKWWIRFSDVNTRKLCLVELGLGDAMTGLRMSEGFLVGVAKVNVSFARLTMAHCWV